MKTTAETASIVCLLVSAALGAAFPMSATAQTYPDKPIRVIVPYSAGGPADTGARMVGQGLAEQLGQPVVIENRPGAGGNIGTEFVARSDPDGYVLGIGANTTGANVGLYKHLPYDPIKSFAPISIYYKDANILVVSPSSPVNSVKDLIALAKSKPGELTYSSSGNGTSTHLSGALFNKMAGVNITHVPYKGVPPAITAVLSDQVTMFFASSAIVAPYIKSGRLKPLGVTSAKRLPNFPEIPTISEAALPGFEATTWTGLMAPAGTPPAIIEKLNEAVIKVLNSPSVRNAMETQGFEVRPSTPKEMSDLIAHDIDKWGTLIRESGATVD